MIKKYATKSELKEVAKKYCEVNGYTFLFISDDKTSFGYEVNGGFFVHKSFIDLYFELGGR